MGDEVLSIDGLRVSVEDTEIIKGLSLNIRIGEIHAIMGRNGSGTVSYTHLTLPTILRV